MSQSSPNNSSSATTSSGSDDYADGHVLDAAQKFMKTVVDSAEEAKRAMDGLVSGPTERTIEQGGKRFSTNLERKVDALTETMQALLKKNEASGKAMEALLKQSEISDRSRRIEIALDGFSHNYCGYVERNFRRHFLKTLPVTVPSPML